MSQSDNSLYTRNNATCTLAILLYVDDLIIGGVDLAAVQKTKSLLSNKFEMKDLGELHYFLGIEVIRTLDGMLLTQLHYELNLLSKFGMTECKPISTPLDRNLKLTADCDEVCDTTLYRQIIGSLIYLTITRPDISYAVGVLSQFMQSPRTMHLNCAK